MRFDTASKFSDKVILDIDFTDEAVVQCDVPLVKIDVLAVKMLLQMMVIYQ